MLEMFSGGFLMLVGVILGFSMANWTKEKEKE